MARAYDELYALVVRGEGASRPVAGLAALGDDLRHAREMWLRAKAAGTIDPGRSDEPSIGDLQHFRWQIHVDRRDPRDVWGPPAQTAPPTPPVRPFPRRLEDCRGMIISVGGPWFAGSRYIGGGRHRYTDQQAEAYLDRQIELGNNAIWASASTHDRSGGGWKEEPYDALRHVDDVLARVDLAERKGVGVLLEAMTQERLIHLYRTHGIGRVFADIRATVALCAAHPAVVGVFPTRELEDLQFRGVRDRDQRLNWMAGLFYYAALGAKDAGRPDLPIVYHGKSYAKPFYRLPLFRKDGRTRETPLYHGIHSSLQTDPRRPIDDAHDEDKRGGDWPNLPAFCDWTIDERTASMPAGTYLGGFLMESWHGYMGSDQWGEGLPIETIREFGTYTMQRSRRLICDMTGGAPA